MATTETPAAPSTRKVPAGNLMLDDRIRHQGELKLITALEPSKSGATVRITFEDGSTFSPRSTTPVAKAPRPSEQAMEQVGPHADEVDTLEERLLALPGVGHRMIASALEEAMATTPVGPIPDPDTQVELLPTEIRERLAKPRPGLTGKALAVWVITGEGTAEQTGKAKAAREASNGNKAQTGARPGSMTDAMIEVLRGKRKGMSNKEIWAEIQERKLWSSPKGKTPDATIGAKLATEAKKPHGLFKRTEPGRFVLGPAAQ